MKHPIASRLVLACALFATHFSVGLMTSEAQAQRRPDFGREGMVQRDRANGGERRGDARVNDPRRDDLRRDAFRRDAMRAATGRWGRDDRFRQQPAPRWQQRPRYRRARGRW
jgi:hypothetical protein